MGCLQSRPSSREDPDVSRLRRHEQLSSQVVEETGRSTSSAQAQPVTTDAPSEQNHMVQVISDDHPLAGDYDLLFQHVLAQHPDFFTAGAATRCRLMPALQNTENYVYTPLGPREFRLVALHPGSGSQDLVCSLTTLPLDAASLNEYEAISYSWGPSDQMHLVRCNSSKQGEDEDGQTYMMFPLESNYCIKVSNNLRDALFRLRVTDDFRMLWIDAICINQEDMQERSIQVQHMAEIYESADNVIVWLGEEDAETERAFECAIKICNMKTTLSEKFPDPMQLAFGVVLHSFPETHPLYVSKESWRALCRLFTKRSWFQRVWVIQEVIMASSANVVCGSHSMDWERFKEMCDTILTFGMCDYDRALRAAGHQEPDGDRFDDPTIQINETLNKGTSRDCRLELASQRTPELLAKYSSYFRLESLLARARNSEATNARDKVYGLWSMAIDFGNLPPVDYSKSVRQVYVAAAKYWIINNMDQPQGLSAFFSCLQMANPLHQLPSWVTDWSAPNAASHLGSSGNFRASGDTKADMRFVDTMAHRGPAFGPAELWFIDFRMHASLDHFNYFPKKEDKQAPDPGDSLAAKGVRVFNIIAAEYRRTLSHKCAHAAKISQFPDPYPTTSKTYLEIYPLILNPQRPEDFLRSAHPGCPDFWEYVKEYETMNFDSKSGLEGSSAETTTPDQQRRPTQDDLDRTLTQFIPGLGSASGPYGLSTRSFFVTSNGFMGLGPLNTAAGDEVCILYGTQVPLIIRTTSNKGRYLIVGECYIYGIMSGEVMENLPGERVEEILFD